VKNISIPSGEMAISLSYRLVETMPSPKSSMLDGGMERSGRALTGWAFKRNSSRAIRNKSSRFLNDPCIERFLISLMIQLSYAANAYNLSEWQIFVLEGAF